MTSNLFILFYTQKHVDIYRLIIILALTQALSMVTVILLRSHVYIYKTIILIHKTMTGRLALVRDCHENDVQQEG